MKEVCKECPLAGQDELCRKRQCRHADIPVEVVQASSEPEVEKKFQIVQHQTIQANGISFWVRHTFKDTFVARVDTLDDKDGHFGSYVKEGRYYNFVLITDLDDLKTWEIPEEGTERFHEEGTTASQFLLYWDDGRFCVELDS